MRMFPWILILLLAVGGAFLSTNYQSVSKFPVAVEPSAQQSTTREVADDEARQALAALQQTVKDLQTSQQDAAKDQQASAADIRRTGPP
jgi:hypothetical protein